jgi:hypothetical protein
MAHTCNHNTGEAKAGGLGFKVSKGYILRPCLKNKRKQRKREGGRKGREGRKER